MDDYGKSLSEHPTAFFPLQKYFLAYPSLLTPIHVLPTADRSPGKINTQHWLSILNRSDDWGTHIKIELRDETWCTFCNMWKNEHVQNYSFWAPQNSAWMLLTPYDVEHHHTMHQTRIQCSKKVKNEIRSTFSLLMWKLLCYRWFSFPNSFSFPDCICKISLTTKRNISVQNQA